MKLAVAILVILGVVAACAAAVLFKTLNLKPASVPIVDVVVAQADLPARTHLTADQVKVERVPRTGLPVGSCTSSAQVIGRTLKMAVVKDQPLTASCLLPENEIDNLLKPGMLAFQIPLGRHSTAVDLLYPGCIVDVFATFPLQDRTKGDAVTTPLLQNIQVLSVRDETVVTASEEKNGKGNGLLAAKKSAGPIGDVTVAMEVTSRQAAALQLARERGTLGLAMRNPLDKKLNPTDPMVVKEGQLAASGEAMDAQTLDLFNQLQALLGNKPISEATKPPARASSAPTWATTVIRARTIENVEFKLSGKQDAEMPPAAGGVHWETISRRTLHDSGR